MEFSKTMEKSTHTKTDTLINKNELRLPDLQVDDKKSSGVQESRGNRHFLKQGAFLDPFILVDCFEISFYTTSSTNVIYELLCDELCLPEENLSQQSKVDFLTNYKDKKMTELADNKYVRFSHTNKDNLYGLKILVKRSVIKPTKEKLVNLKMYEVNEQRNLYHKENVIDVFAVSKNELDYVSGMNQTIANNLIQSEIESRPHPFKVKLDKLETCVGLNTKDIEVDFIRVRSLLNYLGSGIYCSGITYHDVYLKISKEAVSKDYNRQYFHLKAYKKLMADARHGQIRLELVEHNIMLRDKSLNEVLEKHKLFLDQIGVWLRDCLNQKAAIPNSQLKVLLNNSELLGQPLNEQRIPERLSPLLVKLDTKELIGQWLLSPEYSQFITERYSNDYQGN